MKIAQVLADYSLGEADLLRRAMGKKIAEEMAQQKSRFLEGAKTKGVEAAKAEGIAFRIGTIVTEVLATDGAATGLRVAEQAPTGATGASGASWAPVPGSDATIHASTILVAVGEEPDPSILPEGAGIEVSAFAGIVADARTLATGHAGVFAGGDVVSGPKTIIDAGASGRRAGPSPPLPARAPIGSSPSSEGAGCRPRPWPATAVSRPGPSTVTSPG